MDDGRWQDCVLGDLITLQRGYDITKKAQSDGPYPVVSSSGPTSTHIAFTDAGPGVVIGRKGTLGKAFYVDGPYWAHDTTLWVKDFKGNDRKFVFYLLKSMNLAAYDVGSSNPTLNRNHLHLISIRVPIQVDSQRRIANVLSTYDELIEVNQRRIAILAEMARRLFDEWFVRFRFPGHEIVPMVETELGILPDGWDLETARNALSYTGGGTPSKSETSYWQNGSVAWFTPTDLTRTGRTFLDSSSLMITEAGLAKSSARLFPPFSIMMTSRATLGVFAINTTPATTNQGFITFIPGGRTPRYFLYHMLKREFPRMEAVASGATFKEITKGALGELMFALPPEHLVQRFERLVTPLMEQVAVISRQSDRLRDARDLLLPKLISGEIDLSTAEEKFAEAAE
ncbi:restriction endonuclease subunit S [Ensifer sp.]|jgi:type I restriction enzyme S subunit|uniref:restriction endonuclease subunit S n=1 Tax=Ensifer sp. TaxID=1872086 RepID=UPI002E10DCB8|nr:restriction endonuclease subunit S [Ensifer sp.]